MRYVYSNDKGGFVLIKREKDGSIVLETAEDVREYLDSLPRTPLRRRIYMKIKCFFCRKCPRYSDHTEGR